eukprot:3696977-Rhodomonas_salina.1
MLLPLFLLYAPALMLYPILTPSAPCLVQTLRPVLTCSTNPRALLYCQGSRRRGRRRARSFRAT